VRSAPTAGSSGPFGISIDGWSKGAFSVATRQSVSPHGQRPSSRFEVTTFWIATMNDAVLRSGTL